VSPSTVRRPRPESGFSFIEILIVMAIIAVLAGLVTVALGVWARKGPEFDSRARAQKLQQLADSWKLKFQGWYPPTDLTKMHMATGSALVVTKVPNRSNDGIEALVQALHWPGFGIEAQIGEGETGNTDEDSLDKEAARGRDLVEVVDGYGNPLVYFPNTEYAAADQNPPTYVLGDGTVVTPRPWRVEGGFAMTSSVQVYSMGPDGEPNTDDDIKGWEN
jgi:prepilin-type N-terminal cleavage/methylation domain-containing protein